MYLRINDRSARLKSRGRANNKADSRESGALESVRIIDSYRTLRRRGAGLLLPGLSNVDDYRSLAFHLKLPTHGNPPRLLCVGDAPIVCDLREGIIEVMQEFSPALILGRLAKTFGVILQRLPTNH